jgi:hypothetical protein
MRSTHHFITVFSLLRLNKKKRNSEKHTGNIFGVFGFSKKKSNSKEKKKNKNEKIIYTGKLPTSKRRIRKSFWVFF